MHCFNITVGNVPYFPLSGPNKSLTIKIQRQIARFLGSFELKLQVKGRLINLFFSQSWAFKKYIVKRKRKFRNQNFFSLKRKRKFRNQNFFSLKRKRKFRNQNF